MIINMTILKICKYFDSMPQIWCCSAAFRAHSIWLSISGQWLRLKFCFFFFFLLPSNRYFIVLGEVSVHVCSLPLSGRERGPISTEGRHRYTSIHLRVDTKMHSACWMGCSAFLVLLLSNTQDIKCSILNINSYKIILQNKMVSMILIPIMNWGSTLQIWKEAFIILHDNSKRLAFHSSGCVLF